MADNQFLFYTLIALANFAGFVLVGVDKKRSHEHQDRLPEVYLFFVSIFFASLGVLTGMYFFRHKTRKFYFPFGISLLLIEQLFLLMFINGYIQK